MAVMLISRYVAQLYCLMVQVRRLEYLYLLRATKLEEAQAAGADFVGGRGTRSEDPERRMA